MTLQHFAVDTVQSKVPAWVTGGITRDDMEFLYQELLRERPDQVIEIGTASGVSTALILSALASFDQAELLPTNKPRTVVSYDYSERLYFDKTKLVGAAVTDICPENLANLQLRNPYTVLDFHQFHPRNSIKFLFLDANHAHPCPCLDLLLLIDYLAEGALVVFHDIHLGTLMPEFFNHGVDYLFAELTGEIRIASNAKPNIGSWRLTGNQDKLKKTLRKIVLNKRWDKCPPVRYLRPTAKKIPDPQYILKFLSQGMKKMVSKHGTGRIQ